MIITMKSFKQFLIENEQQYDFRIKVARECDSDMGVVGE